MKNTFKKAVSVLLAVIMVASLCTMAITTVSAEETTTYKDHGIYSGTGAEDRFLVDDPTGTGDKVIKMAYGNGRYNYRLADPADPSNPFVVVKGTYYTIKFEYMVNAVGAETNNFGFEPYYGLTDQGGHGRKYASMSGTSGISADFIGDGKWHSAAITFLADPFEVTENVVTGQDPETGDDITETNVIATLNNIYFTYYNSVGIDGYLKNITIVAEENAIGGYSNTEYDMLAYVNADGTANANRFNGTNASAMTGSFKNTETGNLVVVPASNNNGDLGGLGAVQYLTLYKNKPLQMAAGNTYSVVAKYKVNEVSADSTAGVEFGIGYSRDTGIGWSETNIVAVNNHSVATDEWYYITATVTPSQAQYLRLYVRGKSSKIEIDYVQVSATGMDNAVSVIYNDNGVISTKAGYKETDIIVEGSNGANGEKFMGWYADAKCTEALDGKVPANSGTVFAKYPTTVIDKFYMFPNYVSGTHVSKGTFEKSANGWKLGGSSSHGFLIPAYDDSTVAFYEFKPGVEYIVRIHYASHTVTAASSTASNVNLYYGDGYGANYVRTIGVDGAGVVLATTTEPGVIEFKFTHKTTTKTVSEVEHIVNTAIMRASSDPGITGVIDMTKIEIVELTEDAFVNGGLKSTITLDYNDGVTENETFTVGYYDIKELPVPTRDGYIFAGWYKNYRNTSHRIDVDDIPVSALAGHMGNYNATYVAQWVSTAVNRVEFSESAYSNLAGGDKGGAFTIINDSAIDAESADHTYAMMDTVSSNKAPNVYKVSFFNDDGSRMLAYEGVTYRFTIRYKIVDDRGSNGLRIGVARSGIGSYGPEGIDGNDSISVVATSKNTDGFETATAEFKTKGIYIADNGITEGVTDRVQAQLALRMDSGLAFIDYVEVTAVSYTPAYANFIENATVTVDYENLTFTVIPDEGYEMKLGTAISKTTYLDYTIAKDPANSDKETCYPVDTDVYFYSDLYAENDGYTYGFYYDVADGDRLSSIAFMAEMVEKGTTVNADIIAMSIREEKAAADNDGVYQSAGIRFRARISDSTLAGATEIGYVFAPTNALIEANTISMEDYLALDGNVAVKGIAKAANTDVIYEKLGENYTDYQAVLTGLTNEAGTKDLTDLEISVAFYVTGENGTTYFQYDSVKFSDLQ